MKLTYNVLCVDDDISLLSSLKEGFRTFNESVGIRTEYQDIEVKIGAREDPADFKNRIEQDLASKFQDATFEFILVDLHMTGGMNGEHIISAIRGSHSIYRPIIFYSAGTPPADDTAIKQLTEEAERADILGKSIFITPRSSLQTKLEEIASEMHKEEHKINQVRGLLMDGVSEIDAKILLSLKKPALWNDTPEDKKQKIISTLQSRVRRRAESSTALLGRVQEFSFDNMKDFFAGDEAFSLDLNTRSEVLREILRGLTQYSNNGNTLSSFYNSQQGSECLADIRNQYGHRLAADLDDGHTDEKCKYIREETRRHLQNVDEVLSG